MPVSRNCRAFPLSHSGIVYAHPGLRINEKRSTGPFCRMSGKSKKAILFSLNYSTKTKWLLMSKLLFCCIFPYVLSDIRLFLKEIRNLDGLFFHLTGRCSRLLHGRDGSTLRSLRNIRLDSSLRICRMCNMGRIQTCC